MPIYVCGVDSSTQSVKVVIRDAETGALIREGRAAHPEGSEVILVNYYYYYLLFFFLLLLLLLLLLFIVFVVVIVVVILHYIRLH